MSSPNASPIPAQPQPESTWLAEAAQLANADPLVECFALLSGKLHHPISVAQLKSSLTTGSGKVSPVALVEAAEFHGFDVRVLRVPLNKIAAATLPAILILKGDRACVVEKRVKEGFEVVYPETPAVVQQVALKAMERDYAGFAMFARPGHHKRRIDKNEGVETANEGWFWSAIMKHKKVYADVLLAALIVNLFALISPLFVMNVYDRVVPNRAIETLWVLAIGVLIAYAFDFFLRGLRAYFVDAAGRETDRLLSGRLFRQLLSMRLDTGRVSAGALADELKQYESLREFFSTTGMLAMLDFAFMWIFLVAILLVGGWLVLVPLITVPIVFAIGWWMQKPLDELVKEGMKERAYKNSLLVETIAGLETVKTQNAEAELQNQWSQLVEVGGRNWVKTRMLSNFVVNFAAWVSQLSSVLMVILGVYLIADQKMTTGALVACVILMGRVMAPLAGMASLLARFDQSRASLKQLDEFMKRETDRTPGKNYIEKTTLSGDFRFQQVKFKYPDQQGWALDDINLSIHPGERVAIIGGMGSGKSSILRLLTGLYLPTEGSLMVDGVDIRQIDPSELRAKVGFVEQTPFLFAGSLRDNIALGHRDVDDAAIIRAARIAGVTEFTANTEAGLAQQVGERGALLSGGQRQAVALARAFLFDPPVMLMDEPTGAMDQSFEARFIDRLSSVVPGKTVIIVTHRRAMLALCERLIVMDQGVILADGPKDEVINALKAGTIRRARPSASGQIGSLT